MQPPDIEILAQENDADNSNRSNVSTIENNDTMGKLPKF